MRATLLAVLIASTAIVAIPLAASEHCESRVSVYARHSFAPTPLPPYHQFDANACRLTEDLGVDGHTFAPNVDQIFVRVNGAFGSALTTLRVELQGMGFDNAEFTLQRVAETGGATYQMSEWLFVPDIEEGTLTATVYYPRGATFVVTYHANAVQLPLPPLPAAPEP